MTDTNLSAVLFKKQDLRLVDRPIPEPGPGEVQISMRAVGICGSDVKFWAAGAIGPYIVKEPMLLGHECAGVVSKLGEGVNNLKVGDRVAIEPGVTCRKCPVCKGGRYNLCPDVFFLATPPDSGALARYHTHAADFVYKLPDNLSFEEGSIIEPLSVGLHSSRLAGVKMGGRVLITGAGPVGLCILLASKAMGAAAVCLTDIDPKRLEFAKQMGATCTVLVDSKDPEVVAKKVHEALGGEPEHTIEASGAQFSVDLVVMATKTGGTIVIVGLGAPRVEIPIVNLVTKEITLRGSLRYANTWPDAIELLSSGKIDVKPMVSHRFKLEETLKAFETAKSGVGIKVMINCEKEG